MAKRKHKKRSARRPASAAKGKRITITTTSNSRVVKQLSGLAGYREAVRYAREAHRSAGMARRARAGACDLQIWIGRAYLKAAKTNDTHPRTAKSKRIIARAERALEAAVNVCKNKY